MKKKGVISKIVFACIVIAFIILCLIQSPITSPVNSLWSLLPPVVAIGLALITKEVYSSLFLGIVTGGVLCMLSSAPVSVGEGGLRVERPQYRAGLPFEALAWAYEDRAVFLFSLGAGMFCFLPKRCLSGEECVQIRNYLSSALRKKFRQEGFHG